MNKEILYRAKTQGTDKWIFGLPYSIHKRNLIDSMFNYELRKVEFIHTSTLSQFIGITDKNGVKIFENDILLHGSNGKYMKVYFNQDNMSWFCKYINFLEYEIHLSVALAFPITKIGNIYDNQDLFEI